MSIPESDLQAAREVLASLHLEECQGPPHPRSGHHSSLLLVGQSRSGERFLLKYYLTDAQPHIAPVGLRPQDFRTRELGFYRVLDSIDPSRHALPAPKTIVVDPSADPRWILLQWLAPAAGPVEETLDQAQVIALLQTLATVPLDRLLGRRGAPLEHWDPVSYFDRVRGMYDSVLFVLGEPRWRRVQRFFAEAVRWTDGRPHAFVHGDFCEANIVVSTDGKAHLLDFESVGIGNRDHDFTWFWLHSGRHPEWKKQLLHRWMETQLGSDRIRSEWGVRSACAYLAIRRLRWGYLTHGEEDPRLGPNLALLDAALAGGQDLFPA